MREMKVQGPAANCSAQAASIVRPENHDAGKANGSAAGKPGKIALRAQQRLARAAVSLGTTYLVLEGVLAIDVVACGGQRQITDFLASGDVVPPCVFLAPNTVSIRAITGSVLGGQETLEESEGQPRGGPQSAANEALFFPMAAQLARGTINQIMIGTLDSEPRVASFLLIHAMRSFGGWQANRLLPLPMSRDDIADHLAMNRDTLSRIMMRFETLGLLERVNRHTIRILDFDNLTRLVPITALIMATLGRPATDTPPN